MMFMLKYINHLLKLKYFISNRYQKYINNAFKQKHIAAPDINFDDWLSQLSSWLDANKCSSLMLHCKFSSINAHDKDPKKLISYLKQRVDAGGLLVFPAFELEASQEKFLETTSHVTLTQENINTGIFAKLAHDDKEFYRTLHPTHSMLVYPSTAKSHFENHGADGSFSLESSPISALEDKNGWILNIGVGLNSTTSIHLAEERDQNRFPITTLSKLTFDGTISNMMELKRYSVRPISKSLVTIRNCDWLKPHLMKAGALIEFNINATTLQLINLKKMTEVVEHCALHGITIYGKYIPAK